MQQLKYAATLRQSSLPSTICHACSSTTLQLFPFPTTSLHPLRVAQQSKQVELNPCVIQLNQKQHIIKLLFHVFQDIYLTLMTKIYIHKMSSFNSHLLLLFILPLTLAGITNFWDMTHIDREELECLWGKGYLEEVFVLTAFEAQTQKWQVAVELQELTRLKARTNLVVATAQIQGRLPPQLQAHRLARHFQAFKVDKYWISISNFVAGFQPTCSYLKTFALYLHLYTKKEIGFQSERMFWEDLFGRVEACAELGRYSLYLSFNNFQPFGGWSDYEYFETYRPVPVCNYPGMEVFKN